MLMFSLLLLKASFKIKAALFSTLEVGKPKVSAAKSAVQHNTSGVWLPLVYDFALVSSFPALSLPRGGHLTLPRSVEADMAPKGC